MAQDSKRGGTITTKANGPVLVELRAGRKQRDVEKEANLPYGQLTRCETEKQVSIEYVFRLAQYYKREPKQLVHPEAISTASDLLTALARLLGAKVDFSANGDDNHESELNDGSAVPSGAVTQAGELDEDRRTITS